MADENENLVKISDLPLGHRTDLEGSFVPVAIPNQQTYKVPLEEFADPLEFDTTPTADSTNPVTSGGIKTALDAKQDVFTIVEASASITGSTATVSIEQGNLCIVDLSEEASLTAIEIVLTNNSEASFPCWWFKIKAGSDITLSLKIGAVAVGWLGSEITNIELGKTVEISVVDGIACGGELV